MVAIKRAARLEMEKDIVKAEFLVLEKGSFFLFALDWNWRVVLVLLISFLEEQADFIPFHRWC